MPRYFTKPNVFLIMYKESPQKQDASPDICGDFKQKCFSKEPIH